MFFFTLQYITLSSPPHYCLKFKGYFWTVTFTPLLKVRGRNLYIISSFCTLEAMWIESQDCQKTCKHHFFVFSKHYPYLLLNTPLFVSGSCSEGVAWWDGYSSPEGLTWAASGRLYLQTAGYWEQEGKHFLFPGHTECHVGGGAPAANWD